MRECFWSIHKFNIYLQLGKNYKLYVIRQNKEKQWVEKMVINFLPLLRKSPYRCSICGTKEIRLFESYGNLDGYSISYCPKCDPNFEKDINK